jgi:hypothetical protein
MGTPSQPPAPLTERDLDHCCFLDWLARMEGFWHHPSPSRTWRLELDQGAVLRITAALGDEPAPLTLLDLYSQGNQMAGLTMRRVRPLVALSELRAAAVDPRLLLEATMQRRRLYPRWIAWMEGAAHEDPDVRSSDLYLLRFLPEISFDELALIARITPQIGPGMMWALAKADLARTGPLFEEWVDAGEHQRFRELGGEVYHLLVSAKDTPAFEQFGRVMHLMVEHGYLKLPIAGDP